MSEHRQWTEPVPARRLNLDDPAIRSMIHRDHCPLEVWTTNRGIRYRQRVACAVDAETWPCATMLALREWEPPPDSDGWMNGGR